MGGKEGTGGGEDCVGPKEEGGGGGFPPPPPPRSAYRNRLRGFNLIEAAVVLGLVGLVVGGIWYASASVYRTKAIKDGIADMLIVHSNTRSLFKGFDMSTTNQRLDGGAARDAGIWRGTTAFRFHNSTLWIGNAYTPWAKQINFRLQNNGLAWDIVTNSTSDCVEFGTRIKSALIRAREVDVYTRAGGTVYETSPTVAQCETEYNGSVNYVTVSVQF